MNQNESPLDKLIAPTPLGILAATCAGAAIWTATKIPSVVEAASRGWRRHTGASVVMVAQPALAVVALLVAALVLWRIRAMMMSGDDEYAEPRRREYDEPRGYREPAPLREYRQAPPPPPQRYDDLEVDEWGDDGSELPDTPQSAGYDGTPEPDPTPPQHPAAPAPQRDRYQTYDSLLDGE